MSEYNLALPSKKMEIVKKEKVNIKRKINVNGNNIRVISSINTKNVNES